MQRRYCQCGYVFWVTYQITESGVQFFFRVKCRLANLNRCPSCGREIDIDELR